MLKKIFLGIFILSSLAFACPNQTLHDSAETLIEQQIFITKKGKTLTLNVYNLSLLLAMQGFEGDELVNNGKQIIFGMNIYANSHGYKIIMENPNE